MTTAPHSSSPDVIPVILDVDTGVDDALALILAVRHPMLDLRAVTCVSGNTNVDQVVANTQYVLDAAGAGDVPVARGATRPLLVPPHHATHVHGPDGLGGFSRPSDRRVVGMHAIDLLRRELMAAIGTGDAITVVPLAPMTNIALLLRTYPEVAPGIARIVFMGGSAQTGNATAVAEFNVFADPEAAAIAIAAAGELSIPITMYGLDVFNDVRIGRERAHAMRDSGDPAAQLAGALLENQMRVFGLDDATIGDAGAVCAVIDPEGVTTSNYSVRVETSGMHTRGQTVVDRRAWSGDKADDPTVTVGAHIDVALDVDGERHANVWLSSFAPPSR
ncbi:nucleoside hydrolase [Nakamurella antarctica]|uniref:Nucleoside hydrolase n=1 Tax=Nakamurella antarctica TaxID=1902245 RepID=A0A3G8ZV01_9ACTN|nr:nucleoside hydrolase [Nakamurella antarctica]AZI57541.1 nucleoside hydrolase [Nakamurella antarctica]